MIKNPGYSVEAGVEFGVQTGCGIDDQALAFAYAKSNPKKSIISAAVILNNGKVPIVELMV